MSTSVRSFAIAMILIPALGWSACEGAPPDASRAARAEAEDAPPARATFPDTVSLEDPGDDIPRRALKLTEPWPAPPCHRIFERSGEPARSFPLEDDAEVARAVFGCQPGGFKRTEDRTFALYKAPERAGQRVPDLMLSVWTSGEDSKLLWSTRIARDRSEGALAGLTRDAHLVDLPPHLTCAGTRWDARVQIACFERDTGKEGWIGQLPIWSGLRPQAAAKSIVLADTSGIRHVYPWTGVERRFQRLERMGARSSLYASAPGRLYYAANRDVPYNLDAYRLDTLEKLWTRALPGPVRTDVMVDVPAASVMILGYHERVFAIDTTTGDIAWAVRTGEPSPPVAAAKDTVYVLVRRSEGANQLVALDGKTGAAKWAADTPGGTLRVGVHEGVLMLGSLYSVQRVLSVDDAP
ncbi:MAG: PLuB system PQQ-binding repeat protein [Myxococcota bacterium]